MIERVSYAGHAKLSIASQQHPPADSELGSRAGNLRRKSSGELLVHCGHPSPVPRPQTNRVTASLSSGMARRHCTLALR